jgi:hypothetical protein
MDALTKSRCSRKKGEGEEQRIGIENDCGCKKESSCGFEERKKRVRREYEG